MAVYRANIRLLAAANAVVGFVPCVLSIDVASMARAADLSALDMRVHSTIVQILGLTAPMCNIVCYLVQLAEYVAIDYLDFPYRIVGFRELVGNNSHLVDDIDGLLFGDVYPAAAGSESEAENVLL